MNGAYGLIELQTAIGDDCLKGFSKFEYSKGNQSVRSKSSVENSVTGVQPSMANKTQGMTLIELVIVLVIVAILAALAYPSYLTQVQKTARQETIGKMYEMAIHLEQFRAQRYRYPTGTDLADFGRTEQRYGLVVNALGDNGAGFEIVATPDSNTGQQSDRCGTMKLNHLGEWSFSTSVAVDDCI